MTFGRELQMLVKLRFRMTPDVNPVARSVSKVFDILVVTLALFVLTFTIAVPALATELKTADEIVRELKGRKKRSGPNIS